MRVSKIRASGQLIRRIPPPPGITGLSRGQTNIGLRHRAIAKLSRPDLSNAHLDKLKGQLVRLNGAHGGPDESINNEMDPFRKGISHGRAGRELTMTPARGAPKEGASRTKDGANTTSPQRGTRSAHHQVAVRATGRPRQLAPADRSQGRTPIKVGAGPTTRRRNIDRL